MQEAAQAGLRLSPWTGNDVAAIVKRRGWLVEAEVSQGAGDSQWAARQAWSDDAARLLGPHAEDLRALESLLSLVFHYDAASLLRLPENHAVMSREGARHVLRELATLVLDCAEVNSDAYKEIIAALKERTARRGQELFHPVRLPLAGRAGEGQYDRVILLLDAASRLVWTAPVKSCRQRILEFCAAME
jgi:hypothetical protein